MHALYCFIKELLGDAFYEKFIKQQIHTVLQ